MLVLSSTHRAPHEGRIWGTGGWVDPEYREALDWLTFARLHGWAVEHATLPLEPGMLDGGRWIVVTGESSTLKVSTRRALEETDAMVVMRSHGRGRALSARLLGWHGPGPAREWHCRENVPATVLDVGPSDDVWATLDGVPVVVTRRVGRGLQVTLGFHPSRARDADGAVTALLRHLLVWGTPEPVSWHDLEGCLVLRMDDPGSSQNVHAVDWSYAELGAREWGQIGEALAAYDARLSIGYVTGWVDDADRARGILEIAGTKTPRVPGFVHPSPLVSYRDSKGVVHDYRGEYETIGALRKSGRVEVELHGHTHMHPDTDAWSTAEDRYIATKWYRELGPAAAGSIAAMAQHPLKLGLEELRRWFGVRPTTLICPGDEWTTEVLEEALDLGLQLVSSYYLGLCDGEQLWWTTHVCGPYLDQASAAWFDSGLPVVGTFHDYEPSVYGVDWLAVQLDRWREAGARRFIDLRELAGVLGRTLHVESGRVVVEEREGAPALVRPLRVLTRRGERIVEMELPCAT